MNRRLLPISVQTHSIAARWRRKFTDRMRHAWDDRADESGVDEAVTKMIWLAVGIGVALLATTFFTGVFETARDNVPDPVTP
jgi:Flp pilus assembly protein TadB